MCTLETHMVDVQGQFGKVKNQGKKEYKGIWGLKTERGIFPRSVYQVPDPSLHTSWINVCILKILQGSVQNKI